MSLLRDTWNDWTQRGTLLTSSCYACTRIHCFTASNMESWAQVVGKEGSLLTAGCIEQPLRKSLKFAPVLTLQQPLSITVIWANTKLAAFRGEQMVISTAYTSIQVSFCKKVAPVISYHLRYLTLFDHTASRHFKARMIFLCFCKKASVLPLWICTCRHIPCAPALVCRIICSICLVTETTSGHKRTKPTPSLQSAVSVWPFVSALFFLQTDDC